MASIHRHLRVLVSVLFILGLLAGGSVCGTPSANIIYVKHDAIGNDDGSSWTDAFTDLQDALGIAQAGDEIWVAAGVYYPAPDASDRTATFELQDGVRLYGGFAGTETACNQRDWEANVTVLSGDLDRNDISDETGVVTDTANITGTNAYHVVTGGGVTAAAMLDGFVITAGCADGELERSRGGGLYNWASSPVLTNVTFSGNHAATGGGGIVNYWHSNPTLSNVNFVGNQAGWGGGMQNYRSNPTLTNSTFRRNQARSSGGGMHESQSDATLTDVTFVGNQAEWGGGISTYESNAALHDVTFTGNQATSSGGGMHNHESDPMLVSVTFSGNEAGNDGGGMSNSNGSNATLDDVTFAGNSAALSGGGMHNHKSNPTLDNVTFAGNQAESGGGMSNYDSSPTLYNVTFNDNQAEHGGGMRNQGSAPTLIDVSFTDNYANSAGGGMYSRSASSPTLKAVTFSGNHAGDGGGGMYNLRSTAELSNVAFTGNQAVYGGGMHNHESDPMLINVTLTANEAQRDGGGMYNVVMSNATLVNCILWGNQATVGRDEIHNSYDCIPTIRHSNIQGSGGSGDDWHDGLGTDGGSNIDSDPLFVAPVPADQAPTTEGNYRLREGSPAIDAGTNDAVTLETDLDGKPRIVDGTGNGDAVVDMGAYEFQIPFEKVYLPLVLGSH